MSGINRLPDFTYPNRWKCGNCGVNQSFSLIHKMDGVEPYVACSECRCGTQVKYIDFCYDTAKETAKDLKGPELLAQVLASGEDCQNQIFAKLEAIRAEKRRAALAAEAAEEKKKRHHETMRRKALQNAIIQEVYHNGKTLSETKLLVLAQLIHPSYVANLVAGGGDNRQTLISVLVRNINDAAIEKLEKISSLMKLSQN